MDKTRQGILYNHDNDFLHYEDDWYTPLAVVSSKLVFDFLHYEDDWYTPLVVVSRGWRTN